MGAFVTVYNYLTFRLSEPPFGLSASVIGALFTVYLAGRGPRRWLGGSRTGPGGTWCSPRAWR